MSDCVEVAHGVKVKTAYGWRQTCSKCRRRWTKLIQLNGQGLSIEGTWIEEKYSPLRDNRDV